MKRKDDYEMDYEKWGEEYLSQAQVIVGTLKRERPKLACLPQEKRLCRERELDMLYTMYLECAATGKKLKSIALWRNRDIEAEREGRI